MPRGATDEESPQRVRALPGRHQSRTRAGEQHEDRRAEVRDPPRQKDGSGDVRIAHRVGVGPDHREVPYVVDRHDDDDQPADYVDRAQPVPALIGRIADRGISNRDGGCYGWGHVAATISVL
jgi:hypothetical protein